jgi:hypothetical protein
MAYNNFFLNGFADFVIILLWISGKKNGNAFYKEVVIGFHCSKTANITKGRGLSEGL